MRAAKRVAKRRENSDLVYYYHPDHLGSMSVVTDTNGNRVGDLAYYPFGETRVQTGSFDDHKYTGKKLDDSTGLYYYGARYYDATLGQFISPDTIVASQYDPQNLNRYSYVENNPINFTDPTGHWKLRNFLKSAVQVGTVAAEIYLGPGGLQADALLGAGSAAATTALTRGANFGTVIQSGVVGFSAGLAGGAVGAKVGGVVGSAASKVAGTGVGGFVGAVAAGASGGYTAGATPGGAPVSIFHDDMQIWVGQHWGETARTLLNVFNMVPAVAITLPGFAAGPEMIPVISEYLVDQQIK
ncbi:MAG: RHS repeat-associated core domain-containing protein [Methylococcales bacterium]